jgi:hypothetical protein
MVRLNLQLFAKLNTNTSVVDYLKSQGKDSSYSARKKLAQELGIKNYSGTASQNTQMLKTLKSQASSGKTNSGKTNTNTNTKTSTKTNTKTTSTPKVTPISGADQSLVDKANSSFKQSSNVTNAQTEANSLKNKYNELASITDIIDQKTWDTLNSSFATSDAYNQAMQYTNQLLEQLSSGRTSYTDQIKDLMGQIQNRDKFQYDVAEDSMFQQALSSAMASGQTAMQDTIGQASALTGGYASTYAQSVGNQAYNSYIQDAYNNLPAYYNMALEAYQMEGQEMYNQLSMLNEADATEFQRMYDSWNANFTNAQNMYAQEYGAWQDGINNAYNSANLQLNEHGMAVDNAYNMYQASQNRADTLYAQEYQKWADEVANAMQYMGMQNTDYWNNQNFIEGQRQHNDDMAYKYSALKQEQDQFNTSLKYKNSGGGDEDEDGIDLKAPTQTQKQKALEAFNTGGEDAYYQYLDSLPSNVDVEEIDLYVNGDGKDNKGYGRLPLEKRTFTIIDDGGVNWLWGVDNNAVVKDQYGKQYKLSDLKKENKDLALALSDKKLKKGQTFTMK